MDNTTPPSDEPLGPVFSSANIAPPVQIKLQVDGIAGNVARPGEQVQVIHRCVMTSDHPTFHKFAAGLATVIGGALAAKIRKAEYVVIVINEERDARVWIDTAAVALQIMAKRNVQAGEVIFDDDVADVLAMNFPHAGITETDQVMVIFREGWRFGMYLDFNPERKLDMAAMERALGAMYREMAHRNLYETMSNQTTKDVLIGRGWFPFLSLKRSEFSALALEAEAGSDFERVESELVSSFDNQRLERVFEHWIARPAIAAKATILRSAIDGYLRKDPVATIKTLLTEIEGILNDEHERARGTRCRKVGPLLEFAVESAKTKAGASDTLLFPLDFTEYLSNYAFASFSPASGGKASAGSRHAVGHGAAASDSYTMTRALQAILTLDQFVSYL